MRAARCVYWPGMRGRDRAAEGVDRLRPPGPREPAREAAAARALRAGPDPCAAPSDRRGPGAILPIDDPGDFEAFFGAVRARARAGAVRATVDARRQDRPHARRSRTAGSAPASAAPPARGRLDRDVRSATGSSRRARDLAMRWLLPRSAAVRTLPASRHDARLAASSPVPSRSFSAIARLHARPGDPRERRVERQARFPAASTVKLGVLAAALGRSGRDPRTTVVVRRPAERSPAGSSNLAATGCCAIGGSAAVARRGCGALGRLGARSSYRQLHRRHERSRAAHRRSSPAA